ncbi:MAG: DoxX family protein [Bacteroidetes bacterium]|nr:DoxX family protein [Bacteroidota bacterium]
MKLLLNICRFLVGVLFIFSGLIKANDPLGLSYKMQEFFEVWNFHLFDNYTLAFSVLMIVFEIVAGVAILLGWRMKLFGWLLLLLIIFFSFLTGYAYLSGKIKECGCFGNCIPLTSGESFAKDIILFVLILFLFINQRKIKPLLGSVYSIGILATATVLSFIFQWYVLRYLPVVDCLPYKVGANIEEGMKPPPGAIPDSTVITFVYEKDNKQVEFTSDKFPADFGDSYKFIRRYDKLVRKGNAEPAIKDFILQTVSGNDTTQALLEQKGYYIFIFAKELPETNPSWNKEFNVALTFTKLKNIPVFFITANADQVQAYVQKNGLENAVTILQCDATAIKTAARVNPTMYLLKKGTIINKWSYAEFEEAIVGLNELPTAAQQ